MDTKENMIFIKDEIRTSEIQFCQYIGEIRKVEIVFNSGKKYMYLPQNVKWLKEPEVLNPEKYRISIFGHRLSGMKAIYVFRNGASRYWHICFEDGTEEDYRERDLKIIKSCLEQKTAKNVFEYIKQTAEISGLRNEKTGEKLLAKKFEKISFVGDNLALAKYLSPSLLQKEQEGQKYIPIFPFGCNNSQYKAVRRAMENQISVIQGPPGTGKTQTILNIIANILMQGKTVQIVSNNNTATENIYQKLSSPEYNLGFLVAVLGKTENKQAFIMQQNAEYPDFSLWNLDINERTLQERIGRKAEQLGKYFDKIEQLAKLKQEQSYLETELEYFNEYVNKSGAETDKIKIKKELISENWMELWQECQTIAEEDKKIGLLLKIKNFFSYGISGRHFYHQDIAKVIITFQKMYYHQKQTELKKEIAELEAYIESTNENLSDELCSQSMTVLKNRLANKYDNRETRGIFNEEDLWKNPNGFLEEYPVILSTAFSSRTSLKDGVVYDYLIMDEASQVDIATGALALSCAENVIIVGDTKQLPNVVTEKDREKAEAVFSRFQIHEGYHYTKSFLQSVLDVMPDVTQTLLREHYRCHPKIINFCNQKFYRGELVVMTEDKGEDDVLAVVKTVPGNHVRNHYSQRQIDIIKNEILPEYVENTGETGIIAPYKNQVKELEKELESEFKDMDISTVHKFQGKEKDTIIISTVDDQISDFADDPYLINVAVSRAKKKLVLVVTGNRQTRERNILDLVEYIQYHNFEVTESRVYSVFDYLYKQYARERQDYLQRHKKVSSYDSENLMYALIEDVLAGDRYSSLDILCHFPLNMLIKNTELLSEREYQYAMHPAAHVDFLLYNRISKKPVLAVEVDGYDYHSPKTEQASRDTLKDHILELCDIPLLRFKTNGSGEKEKIEETLERINE